MPTSPQEKIFALLVIVLLACVCLTLFAETGQPAVRFVSPQGNDSNSCATSQAPGTSAKRTLNGAQGAIPCMQPGDTLLLQDAAWHEQVSDYADDEHPGTKRPPSGLSWSQPTVIKAEHPRMAILDKPQAGHPYNHTVFFGLRDTQYISIEGLVIDGRGHGACVWVGPSSHIRFQNNLIKNCGRNGVMGSVADDGSGLQDIHLLDNEIYNFSIEETGYPGAHGIYFTGSHSVARGNYIHAPCPFYGVHFTSEHGGLYSNLIENNRVQGCHQAGIFSQGRDSIVRNNLLENNCIGIYLSSAPTQVANNTVYGYHTAWNCGDSYGIFDKSGGSTLANNLLLQQKVYSYSMNVAPTMHTNLCDASAPGCQLQAAPGSVVVDGAGGNLLLKAGSPAINTGTTLAQVPTDRLGVVRPQGGAYDIGAYESTGTAPPPDGGDTTAPVVAVTAPSDGALVSGTAVSVRAEASDDTGVVGLQWLVNGVEHGGEESAAPYGPTVDTTLLANGIYTIAARARDAAGHVTTSAPIKVLVFNGQLPPRPPVGEHPPLHCIGALKDAGVIALDCVPVVGTRAP